MDNPNLNPEGQGQGKAPAGQGQEPPAGGQPSKYEQLAAKKGYKTPDDLASSYEALEPELGKSKNAIDKARKQLESAGYTMDDEGMIKPKEQQQNGYQAPGNGYQAPGQGQYQQPPQEPIYDPYTGQAITDPLARHLATLPVGQREAFVFTAMQEQREKQQSEAYGADSEVLSKPEAKGFEDDVRKAMMSKPLAQRANKQVWYDTLLQVKGARYDTDRTAWQKNGVDDFLNKEGQQGFQGSGQGSGANDGSRLSPEQEQQYQWYVKNRSGQFKDRKHFLAATSPNYGR